MLAHIPALLSSFVDSDYFAKYLWKHAKDSKQHKVRAVFHLCGDRVLEDEHYKRFMDDLGPEVHVCIQIIRPKSCHRSYASTSSLHAGIFRTR
jgi:hypothetical protein